MHHETTTSYRDPKTFKDVITHEVLTRSLFRVTHSEDKWGGFDSYEPETVPDSYFHHQLDAMIGPREDGIIETFMCTDTNQFVVRGWFTYQDRKWFWSYQYIGDKVYKADVDRLLDTLRLNMGIQP